MQFMTIREPKQTTYRDHWQTSARGRFFHFDYHLANDPTVEAIGVEIPPEFRRWCPREFWPDIEAGARAGCQFVQEHGRRMCCVRLTMVSAKCHDVDTNSEGVRLRMKSCVWEHIAEFAQVIAPPDFAWLTSDVLALARGISADAAIDRYPILSDALRDAGCEDQLIHDHLQLCPDHGPSCWVVEMILHQTRTAGA